MRRIILLRHGEAEPSNPEGDRARHLTRAGQGAALRLGQELRAHGLSPDLILSSDSMRTVETLEGVVRGGGFIGVPVKKLGLLYLAEVDTILDRIYEVEDSVRTLLLIGHNPGWSEAATQLRQVPVGLDTAQAAWLEKKLIVKEDSRDVESSWTDLLNSQGVWRLRGILH
ncbi:MAG: phosphohistidine phosphatase [Proteobacteria bacterium]|nr:MAG: phosphohistidine phosphatase [Pseudomonadota bacterium]